MKYHACKCVVSAVLAIGLVFALAGCPSPPAKVTVPDLAGQAQAAATSLLGTANLTLGTVTEVFHATAPAGQVIGQSPAAGASVNSGSAVNLTVSKGPEPVTVPNVVGQAQATAEAAIAAAGLTVGTVTEAPHATAPVGEVTGQNPAAGASVAPGSAVSLTVSSGPAIVTVPDVVGMDQATAEAAFLAAGLTLGTATTQYYPTVPQDQIYGQTPAAGAEVASGSAVDILISNSNYIMSIEELQKIGNDPGYPLDGTYLLMSDFDATATATWNAGAGFVPIGTESNPFTGMLDGEGNFITGLHISRPTDSAAGDYTGLVGVAIDATIESLYIADCSVSGYNNVGGLVGYMSGGSLTGCTVSGSVSGRYIVGGMAGQIVNSSSITSSDSTATANSLLGRVGGVVGWMQHSTVDMCSATGTVTGEGNAGGLIGMASGSVLGSYATGDVSNSGAYAGGLIGYSTATVYQCYATGDVSAPSGAQPYFGGLIGVGSTNSIEQCFATGNVVNANYAGGLVGHLASCNITQCYATGAVAGATEAVGGLVGNIYKSTIDECYSVGAVTGLTFTGGLVGINQEDGIALNSFWNTQSSGLVSSSLGTGKTTAEMKAAATFTGADWDFTNVWGITEGVTYPFFIW